MKVAVAQYTDGNPRKGLYQGLLEQALADAGHTLVRHPIGTAPPKSVDFAVFWGTKTAPIPTLRELRIPFLVSENRYFGARQAYASLGWNYLARRAIRPAPGNAPRPQPTLRAWKHDNAGKVMILGQVPRDAAVRGIDIRQWESDAFDEARRLWGRETVYRPHPNRLKNAGLNTPLAPIEKALVDENVWLAVSYNSCSGVDAVSAGVPTVAMDEGSMAWEVASHRIGDRKMPDREAWAHALSYTQWSQDEFANGAALAHMMLAYDAARADAERY
jgi:hypothetical protein